MSRFKRAILFKNLRQTIVRERTVCGISFPGILPEDPSDNNNETIRLIIPISSDSFKTNKMLSFSLKGSYTGLFPKLLFRFYYQPNNY